MKVHMWRCTAVRPDASTYTFLVKAPNKTFAWWDARDICMANGDWGKLAELRVVRHHVVWHVNLSGYYTADGKAHAIMTRTIGTVRSQSAGHGALKRAHKMAFEYIERVFQHKPEYGISYELVRAPDAEQLLNSK